MEQEPPRWKEVARPPAEPQPIDSQGVLTRAEGWCPWPGQCSSPQDAKPCLSPGFLKGTSPQFKGPRLGGSLDSFPLRFPGPSGHWPPREEGFCVGNKPRLGTAPHLGS